MKKLLLMLLVALGASQAFAQQDTYINPLDIDYTYMVYNSAKDWSYRSGADPAVVEFQGEYYMFVTRSMGYWHSTDLINWDFIKPASWYFQGSNAPAAFNYKDSVLYVLGNPSGRSSILATDKPKEGNWKPEPSIVGNFIDPAFFIDGEGEDEQGYMYWQSSNVHPLRVRLIDTKKRFNMEGKDIELFNLDEENHGWERFGENNFHPTLKEGYMEGPWMTKHDGKYYLQYAAPGTQFNVYADGVYVGDSPLGPFEYQKHNPMILKPGGFMNGSGHGSTMEDVNGQYWHFASMALSCNVVWERRLSMFPTYFDEDGIMYSNTAYGDYPRYSPTHPTKAGLHNGWMLLSYNKPVYVSSVLVQESKVSTENVSYEQVADKVAPIQKDGMTIATTLSDENTKTYWVAKDKKNAWVEADLGEVCDVRAVQINYHDYHSDIYTRVDTLKQQYVLKASTDGKNWTVVHDASKSYKDAPNDYVQLRAPVQARYIRYELEYTSLPNLAMSDFRVFGIGAGKKPSKVKNFVVERQEDRRDAMITWDAVKGAQGYNVYWGIAPDKMYHSWLVYDKNELHLPSLDVPTSYYFQVEAFNENGISEKTKPVKVD